MPTLPRLRSLARPACRLKIWPLEDGRLKVPPQSCSPHRHRRLWRPGAHHCFWALQLVPRRAMLHCLRCKPSAFLLRVHGQRRVLAAVLAAARPCLGHVSIATSCAWPCCVSSCPSARCMSGRGSLGHVRSTRYRWRHGPSWVVSRVAMARAASIQDSCWRPRPH